MKTDSLSARYTFLIATILLTCTQPLYADDNPASVITFTFAPPADTRYTETVRISRQRPAMTGGVQAEELVSSSDITIRQAQVGWEVVIKPKEYALKLNGRNVLDPFADLQSQVTIMHRLDRQGVLINTDVDYTSLMNLLGKELPPQELTKVTPLIQQRAGELKQKAAAEWNARIGEFVGKAVKIGDSWEQDVVYSTPDRGTSNFTVKSRSKGPEPCGSGSCVRIEQTFSLPSSAGSAAPLVDGILSRLVDPRTMLIYDEASETNMRVNGAVVERETRVFEFKYDK